MSERIELQERSGSFDSSISETSENIGLLDEDGNETTKLPPVDSGGPAWRYLGSIWLMEAMLWGTQLKNRINFTHAPNLVLHPHLSIKAQGLQVVQASLSHSASSNLTTVRILYSALPPMLAGFPRLAHSQLGLLISFARSSVV